MICPEFEVFCADQDVLLLAEGEINGRSERWLPKREAPGLEAEESMAQLDDCGYTLGGSDVQASRESKGTAGGQPEPESGRYVLCTYIKTEQSGRQIEALYIFLGTPPPPPSRTRARFASNPRSFCSCCWYHHVSYADDGRRVEPANAMYFNNSSSSTSQCLLLLLAVLHFNTPRRSYTRKTSVSKSVRAPSAGPVLPGAALHLIITLGYLCLSLSTHSNGCIYFYIAMNKWHKKAKKRNSDN